MNATRTPPPIHPTPVRLAFGGDPAAPAVPGRVVGLSGESVTIAAIAGGLIEVTIDDPGFAVGLERRDLCRCDGRDPVVLVNTEYGLLGLAVGPPEPPDRLAVSYGVVRLEGGSAVEIPGEPLQPSWLLFRCRTSAIGDLQTGTPAAKAAESSQVDLQNDEDRDDEPESDDDEDGDDKSEPDDDAELEAERNSAEATAAAWEFGFDERKFRRLIPRLVQAPLIAEAIREGFAGGPAILQAVRTGAPLDASVADEVYDVVREAFDSAATRVLSLEWYWGAVWVSECEGVYVVSAPDLESLGPFDSLDEALECDHFSCAPEAPELMCTVLEEDKLLAFARGVMGWANEGSIWINGVEYVVDGGDLRLRESADDAP